MQVALPSLWEPIPIVFIDIIVSINDGFRVKHSNPWNLDQGPFIEEAPEMFSPNGKRNTQAGKIIWLSDFTGFQGEARVGSKNNQVYNNTIYIGKDTNNKPNYITDKL